MKYICHFSIDFRSNLQHLIESVDPWGDNQRSCAELDRFIYFFYNIANTSYFHYLVNLAVAAC